MEPPVTLIPRFQACTMLVLLAIAGCATTGQTISETSLEERVSALRIGKSTKADVERILGSDYGTDRNRWAYNFSDTAFDISERTQGPGLGILPISAGVVPTNTRAIVSMAFNEAGVMKHLEFVRLFEEPFINDYWYVIKEGAPDPLASVAKLGETTGMKVMRLDQQAGTLVLEDSGSRAKITIQLDGQTLRLTSHNPHYRLASEYHAYSKREYALTRKIAESDIVQ